MLVYKLFNFGNSHIKDIFIRFYEESLSKHMKLFKEISLLKESNEKH